MCAETGECLAEMFRAGNAGANTAEDHVVVLAAAIGQLPDEWQQGHRIDDQPRETDKELLVRADAGGTSHWFAEECRDRNVNFSLDTTSTDLAALDLRHRRRGRAEQIVRDTKACGLARLPFHDAINNDRWIQLVFAANDLLSWAQRISLIGPLRRATPKTIPHRLLHVAARISPRRLHLDRTWAWTSALHDAIHRLRTRLQPHSVQIRPAIHPGL